jgi:hypothetical protein
MYNKEYILLLYLYCIYSFIYCICIYVFYCINVKVQKWLTKKENKLHCRDSTE